MEGRQFSPKKLDFAPSYAFLHVHPRHLKDQSDLRMAGTRRDVFQEIVSTKKNGAHVFFHGDLLKPLDLLPTCWEVGKKKQQHHIVSQKWWLFFPFFMVIDLPYPMGFEPKIRQKSPIKKS